MKRIITTFALALVCACHEHAHEEAASEEDARPALSFTDWTDTSELFIELPALVRGEPSPCAAHVTKLPSFEALASGRVTVVLRGPGGDERFDSTAPAVPGIFRPVVRPRAAGTRRMLVELHSEALSATHDLGEVTVFADDAAARGAIPEEAEAAGRIPFLKEQQWPIEFGTAVVAERPIRPALRTFGTLRARADGELVVTAPLAGRVTTTGASAFPQLGARVTADDLLAVLSPRLDTADVASLELAVSSASIEARYADRERARLEALRSEGAVPERRVEDATHASTEAQATLAGAQRRLSQLRGVGRTTRGRGVQIRAPLSGTISEVFVAPGAFVEAGTPLFRVTDATQLWLEARVTQVDAPRLSALSGAYFLVDGLDEIFEVPSEAFVARGDVLDASTRSLPVVFAVENASARLPVGAFCRVFLYTEAERRALAVPTSALVDDAGTSVVYVQTEGESFERRIVRVGANDRGFVEILSGVRPGEHVVTRGAWSVKLAASSGAVPAHGHAH